MAFPVIDSGHLAILQAHHDGLVGATSTVPVPPRAEYMRLVGAIGERLALEFLRDRYPDLVVEDANSLRVNQPGYDILISGARKIRISVKALAHVEGFGWPQN